MPDFKDKMIDDLIAGQSCSCEFPSPIHSRLRGYYCQNCGKGCPPSQRNKPLPDFASQKREPDPDIRWAIGYLEDDSDACSAVNGSEDGATKTARRLETVFKRLAREAGYETMWS